MDIKRNVLDRYLNATARDAREDAARVLRVAADELDKGSVEDEVIIARVSDAMMAIGAFRALANVTFDADAGVIDGDGEDDAPNSATGPTLPVGS